MNELEKYRRSIIEGIRKVREDRRYTQAEFAKLLDLSQQQYSKIERGEGSISAEQFLLILDKFVLPLSYFVETKPKEKDEALVLQNALGRLGATHLREIQGIFIPEKYENPNQVIIEALEEYQSSRLIAALAPVIVKNIQRINLNTIEKKLGEWGHENRLWWVLENTLESVQNRLKGAYLPREKKLIYQRAATALINHSLIGRSRENGWYHRDKQADIFDPGITTEKTLENVKSKLDPQAKHWNIVTSIKQSDFENALKDSEAS